MGLKKLAPYRDDQTKQRPNYKALQALHAPGEDQRGASFRQRSKDGACASHSGT